MKTGTEDMRSLIADDSRFGQYAGGKKLPLNKAPILLPKHLNDIARDLKPISGKPLHFKLGTHMENAIEGELQPFFEIHDSRYMMYWQALGENEWRTSEFDIYIDNQLLTSVNNSHRWRTTQFKTVDYAIPSEFVKGKKEIRVKFVAHKGKQIGQIYGVRLVKN